MTFLHEGLSTAYSSLLLRDPASLTYQYLFLAAASDLLSDLDERRRTGYRLLDRLRLHATVTDERVHELTRQKSFHGRCNNDTFPLLGDRASCLYIDLASETQPGDR